jgi:hypothetical protein
VSTAICCQLLPFSELSFCKKKRAISPLLKLTPLSEANW